MNDRPLTDEILQEDETYLRGLSDRLMNIAPIHGAGGGDCDTLLEIADRLKQLREERR